MAASRDQKVWARVKKAYIQGGISQRDLAARYGVPYSQVRRTAKAERWVAERDKTARDVSDAIRADAVAEAARRDDAVLEITDELLQAIRHGVADGTLTGSARDVRDVTDALRAILQYGGETRIQALREQRARIDKIRAEAAERERGKAAETVQVVITGADAALAD